MAILQSNEMLNFTDSMLQVLLTEFPSTLHYHSLVTKKNTNKTHFYIENLTETDMYLQ